MAEGCDEREVKEQRLMNRKVKVSRTFFLGQ